MLGGSVLHWWAQVPVEPPRGPLMFDDLIRSLSPLQESTSLPPVAKFDRPAPSSGCGSKWPTGVLLSVRFAQPKWSCTSTQRATPDGQTMTHGLTPQPTL